MMEKLGLFVLHAGKKTGTHLRQRLGGAQAGWWLATLVVLLVGSRAIWVAARSNQANRCAEEYGSSAVLLQSVQSDSVGNRIVYFSTTESGIGLFLQDVVTGKKTSLRHEPGATARPYRVVWPWSPDDRYFVFTWEKELAICSGQDGQEVATLRFQNNFSGVDWLTADTLVIWGADGTRYLLQQGADKQWKLSDLAPGEKRVFSRSAISSNQIAWLLATNILSMDINTGSNQVVYSAKGFRPFFDYSKVKQEYLVATAQNGNQLWRVRPESSNYYDLKHLPADPTFENAVWINEGKGYAYLSAKPGASSEKMLTVQTEASTEPKKLFQGGKVDIFTPSPNRLKLFIIGSLSNEPVSGLWVYDVRSGELQSIAPALETSAGTTISKPRVQLGQFRLPTGRLVRFRLLLPDNLDRTSGSKHSLVIHGSRALGDTSTSETAHIALWNQALTHRGAFVASVLRNDWLDLDHQAANDMLAVYEHLTQRPDIDAAHVFLYGSSAETTFISPFVEAHPELWAGVMLLDGSQLIDLSKLPPGQRCPPVLLSFGTSKNANPSAHYLKFRDELIRNSVPVTVDVQTETAHYPISIRSRREKTAGIVRFVFDH
jgi:dipeptidyl aminopeptidase/acylaminoacyl peptidase